MGPRPTAATNPCGSKNKITIHFLQGRADRALERLESGAERRAGRGACRYARAATLRHIRRTAMPSCERMKSAIRGAISARNRDPLNTP